MFGIICSAIVTTTVHIVTLCSVLWDHTKFVPGCVYCFNLISILAFFMIFRYADMSFEIKTVLQLENFS